MATTKYKEYFEKMLQENKEAFESFKEVHDAYAEDSTLQEEFNEAGKPIIAIIRDYEDRLCRTSEGSGYGSYTGSLAEKFWGEIRKDYPMIDRVGVIIKKVAISEVQGEVQEFELNKIDLFEIKKIKL